MTCNHTKNSLCYIVISNEHSKFCVDCFLQLLKNPGNSGKLKDQVFNKILQYTKRNAELKLRSKSSYFYVSKKMLELLLINTNSYGIEEVYEVLNGFLLRSSYSQVDNLSTVISELFKSLYSENLKYIDDMIRYLRYLCVNKSEIILNCILHNKGRDLMVILNKSDWSDGIISLIVYIMNMCWYRGCQCIAISLLMQYKSFFDSLNNFLLNQDPNQFVNLFTNIIMLYKEISTNQSLAQCLLNSSQLGLVLRQLLIVYHQGTIYKMILSFIQHLLSHDNAVARLMNPVNIPEVLFDSMTTVKDSECKELIGECLHIFLSSSEFNSTNCCAYNIMELVKCARMNIDKSISCDLQVLNDIMTNYKGGINLIINESCCVYLLDLITKSLDASKDITRPSYYLLACHCLTLFISKHSEVRPFPYTCLKTTLECIDEVSLLVLSSKQLIGLVSQHVSKQGEVNNTSSATLDPILERRCSFINVHINLINALYKFFSVNCKQSDPEIRSQEKSNTLLSVQTTQHIDQSLQICCRLLFSPYLRLLMRLLRKYSIGEFPYTQIQLSDWLNNLHSIILHYSPQSSILNVIQRALVLIFPQLLDVLIRLHQFYGQKESHKSSKSKSKLKSLTREQDVLGVLSDVSMRIIELCTNQYNTHNPTQDRFWVEIVSEGLAHITDCDFLSYIQHSDQETQFVDLCSSYNITLTKLWLLTSIELNAYHTDKSSAISGVLCDQLIFDNMMEHIFTITERTSTFALKFIEYYRMMINIERRNKTPIDDTTVKLSELLLRVYKLFDERHWYYLLIQLHILRYMSYQHTTINFHVLIQTMMDKMLQFISLDNVSISSLTLICHNLVNKSVPIQNNQNLLNNYFCSNSIILYLIIQKINELLEQLIIQQISVSSDVIGINISCSPSVTSSNPLDQNIIRWIYLAYMISNDLFNSGTHCTMDTNQLHQIMCAFQDLLSQYHDQLSVLISRGNIRHHSDIDVIFLCYLDIMLSWSRLCKITSNLIEDNTISLLRAVEILLIGDKTWISSGNIEDVESCSFLLIFERCLIHLCLQDSSNAILSIVKAQATKLLNITSFIWNRTDANCNYTLNLLQLHNRLTNCSCILMCLAVKSVFIWNHVLPDKLVCIIDQWNTNKCSISSGNAQSGIDKMQILTVLVLLRSYFYSALTSTELKYAPSIEVLRKCAVGLYPLMLDNTGIYVHEAPMDNQSMLSHSRSLAVLAIETYGSLLKYIKYRIINIGTVDSSSSKYLQQEGRRMLSSKWHWRLYQHMLSLGATSTINRTELEPQVSSSNNKTSPLQASRDTSTCYTLEALIFLTQLLECGASVALTTPSQQLHHNRSIWKNVAIWFSQHPLSSLPCTLQMPVVTLITLLCQSANYAQHNITYNERQCLLYKLHQEASSAVSQHHTHIPSSCGSNGLHHTGDCLATDQFILQHITQSIEKCSHQVCL